MARGLFITGFTISEVLAIQQRAKELLLEGKTIMNWNDADTSVAKQFTMAVDQVLEECAHALRVLDPATYGSPRIAAASFISGYLAK
jgi:Mlc titration factor MtfA (ptsG expression regulator)